MQIIGLIGIGISLIITGFNAAMFCVVKFNDFKHLEKSVEEIKSCLCKVDDKVDKLSEKVALIEGKLSS